MIFRIYSLFQVVVPLVMIHDVMDILRHYYLYTFKLLDPMPKPAKIEAEKLIGTKVPAYKTNVTDKDALLYALGIGFSTSNKIVIKILSKQMTLNSRTSLIRISLFFPRWEL